MFLAKIYELGKYTTVILRHLQHGYRLKKAGMTKRSN